MRQAACLQTLTGHGGPVSDSVLLPLQDQLVTASEREGTLRVWRIATWTEERSILCARCQCVAATGYRLAVGMVSGDVRVCEITRR